MVATKIFKKCSPHGRLYLYMSQRDFISCEGVIEDIKGIAYTPELTDIQGKDQPDILVTLFRDS